MKIGIPLVVASFVVLSVAGCAGSGTNVPGFGGGAASTVEPTVASTVAPSVPPSATAAAPTPSATATDVAPVDPGSIDCGGVAVTLNTTVLSYTLTGDCPSVSVEGDGITVAGPQVAQLTIKGARNVVTLTSVGPTTVSGNDNTVSAQTLDTFSITGDRNTLNSASTVNTGAFMGNDNQVHAPNGVGAITDSGARNTAGA